MSWGGGFPERAPAVPRGQRATKAKLQGSPLPASSEASSQLVGSQPQGLGLSPGECGADGGAASFWDMLIPGQVLGLGRPGAGAQTLSLANSPGLGVCCSGRLGSAGGYHHKGLVCCPASGRESPAEPTAWD